MCLIIDRPADVAIPTDLVDNALRLNPHGWGLMSATGRSISIRRGLIPGEFPKALASYQNRALVAHFRYTTHGATSLENTHPYPILGGTYAVAHNGTIDTVPTLNPERSDTWHFCKYVLSPILAHNPQAFATPKLHAVLAALIGNGSKLVILRADGKQMTINAQAGMSHNGLWLSNRYSLPNQLPTRFNRKTIGFDWDQTDFPLRFPVKKPNPYCQLSSEKSGHPRLPTPLPQLPADNPDDSLRELTRQIRDEFFNDREPEPEPDPDPDSPTFGLDTIATWSIAEITATILDDPELVAQQIQVWFGHSTRWPRRLN